MVTAEELRRASECAEELLSYLMEANAAAELLLATKNTKVYAPRLLKFLYLIDSNRHELSSAMLGDVGLCFAGVNHGPIILDGVAVSSAHEAIDHEAVSVTAIGFDVCDAELPGWQTPGVERICTLLAEADMLKHPEVMARSFKDNCRLSDKLNELQAMRAQELARALQTVRTTQPAVGVSPPVSRNIRQKCSVEFVDGPFPKDVEDMAHEWAKGGERGKEEIAKEIAGDDYKSLTTRFNRYVGKTDGKRIILTPLK